MNEDNVRQISDEEIKKTLTKEELQQTQVLNLQEVQKAIHYEKVTSKKPAIFVAVIGIICLLFGGSLQIANVLSANKANVQKRETKKETKELKKESYTKKTTNNEDGTNTLYDITYKFEDNKLIGFTKEYTVSAIPGKEEGLKSIEQYKKEYEKLLNEIPGYNINMSSISNAEITLKVIVDYKKLDLTKLNEIQQTKPFTKVDYNKNTSYYTIKSESLIQGFSEK